jgi:ATP-dependent Clp protease ATP-binding subunit ClpA
MATATQSAHRKELDTRQRSSTSRHFEDALREKIVGQDEAVQALVELYQVFCAGLRSPGRPVGNLLFLGRPVQARRALSRPPLRFCSAIAER